MTSTTTIEQAFIKHYEAEVHNAYQRMGSKLRNTVRTINNVKGSTATFQKIGKAAAVTKDRNAVVPSMNQERSNIEISLVDYYAGDWIDALDELKTNTDEKAVLAQAGAYALGRKTDELIFDELKAIKNNTKQTLAYSSASNAEKELNKARILQGLEKLGENDIPDDGQRYALVSWKQWSNLLSIEEFANANYVGNDDLPWNGAQAKYWLGTLWMPHTEVSRNADHIDSTYHHTYCIWYHRSAIGHAIGKEITSDITWHGDHAAHFVNNMMSQGAGVIDPKGVIVIPCKEKK